MLYIDISEAEIVWGNLRKLFMTPIWRLLEKNDGAIAQGSGLPMG